jgi:hypothetical protein
MTESDRITQAAESYEEIPAIQVGKRCGVQWTPWMGDYFTSWSPRNANSNAEGPWDHWVDLAIEILRDPLTAIVRPEAHQLAQQLATLGFYDESNRALTDGELRERFSRKPPPAAEPGR